MGAAPGKVKRVTWRTTKDGKDRWYVDFGRRGRIFSIPLPGGEIPLTDRTTAEKLLNLIQLRTAEGLSLESAIARFRPRSAANRVDRKVEEWLQRLREQATAGERSPSYVRLLEGYERGPFRHLADHTIHDITYGLLEDWDRWMAQKNMKPKTRRNVLGAFHAMLSWHRKRGEISEICEFPSIRVDEHAPTIISPSEQDAILEAFPLKKRGIFLAMVRLGIRPGSVRALDVSDWRDGWLTISKAAKGGNSNAEIRGTKTGRVQRLPISEIAPDLEAWLRNHVPPRDRLEGSVPLFRNPAATNDEKRWLHTALDRNWATACTKVGVQVGLYEGTKHSLGTALFSDGVPERVVQQLFGHADIRSTRRYVALTEKTMVDALRNRRRDR